MPLPPHPAGTTPCPPTLSPGTLAYQAEKHCECCAPTPAAAPLGPRNTMGHEICPADMYSVFAAELTIWSMACMAKLKVMNSHTGLSPPKAEPTAMPVKPACVWGQSVRAGVVVESLGWLDVNGVRLCVLLSRSTTTTHPCTQGGRGLAPPTTPRSAQPSSRHWPLRPGWAATVGTADGPRHTHPATSKAPSAPQ